MIIAIFVLMLIITSSFVTKNEKVNDTTRAICILVPLVLLIISLLLS